ncbi:hypothetical protein EVA_22226 [gut metagenome]|uniref:Uncharacterized protein n=1 Tax=gut metagenome TaxID=749906 RepID=J9F403_9ZZZZ
MFFLNLVCFITCFCGKPNNEALNSIKSPFRSVVVCLSVTYVVLYQIL